MNLAEENFGVPQVMHPNDLAVEKPDERSVMTYISYFCHLSVGQNSRPGTISTEASGPIPVQIHDKGRVQFKLIHRPEDIQSQCTFVMYSRVGNGMACM